MSRNEYEESCIRYDGRYRDNHGSFFITPMAWLFGICWALVGLCCYKIHPAITAIMCCLGAFIVLYSGINSYIIIFKSKKDQMLQATVII